MTNYITIAAATILLGGTAHASEPTPKPVTPAKPAAVSGGSGTAAAATTKAAPARGTSLAGAPTGTTVIGNVPRYAQVPAGSSLAFEFNQAGAQSGGIFKQFTTELAYDEKNLAASTLKVTVQIGSLDTQDEERDTTLKDADLFDAAKFPTATYSARSLDKTPSGIIAMGKLTLRGVTKDLRLPLAIRQTAQGIELAGVATIRRLDYGVGQGDWASNEWVGDDVKLTYKVALAKAK
ncbi:MAG: YceI family protein [Steroidobacteraceae bacterium]|nr:YceI family protein [Steroidobacteraceae bacterium]